MTQSDRAIKKLATDLARIKHEVVSWRGAQADFTSIENGGNFTFKDGDGNVTAIMGGQDDGSNTIRHVDGPTPPIPSGLSAHVDGPIVQVSWDGTFEDADNATYDWSHLEVVAVGPSNESLRGTISDVAGASTNLAATSSGAWTVVARSVSRAEKRSLDGDAGTVEVKITDLSGAIEAVQDSANGKNQVHYSSTPPTPADPGIKDDTWFVGEVGRPNDIIEATNLARNGRFWANAEQIDGGSIRPGGGAVLTVADNRLEIAPGSNNDNTAYVISTGESNPERWQGKTFTVSALLILEDAQSGSINANARRLNPGFVRADGSTNYGNGFSVQPPNVPGTYSLSVTFDVPSDARSWFVRFRSGSTVGSTFWTDVQIEEGSTVHPYFDGDTTSGTTDNESHYRWTGEAHASTSEKYLPALDIGTSDNWNVIEQYRHDGSSWVSVELSHQVFSSVDLGKATVGELDGIRIMGRTVRGEQLSGDAIDGKVITGGTYRTSGGNGSWSDAGLFIAQPDGTSMVRFPTDGSPLSLTASDTQIERASIGDLDLSYGAVRSGGEFTLASGVTAPASPPELTTGWQKLCTLPKPSQPSDTNTLGYWANGNQWVRAIDVAEIGVIDRIETYDYETGQVVNSFEIGLNPRHGLTVIGDVAYVMGKDYTRPNPEVYVFGYDLNTGARVTRWEYTRGIQARNALGNDGTNLIVGSVYNLELWVHKRNPTTGVQVGSDMRSGSNSWPASGGRDLFGVRISGNDVEVVTAWGGRVYLNSNNALVRKTDSANESGYAGWVLPAHDVSGCAWVSGVPYPVDSSGTVYEGSTSASDYTSELCFTWYDGTHETTASPVAVAGVPARETRTVSLPVRAGLQKRLYARAQGGTNWSRSTVAADATVVPAPVGLALYAPPATNSFPNADPATLKSTNNSFVLKGDGSGNWGQLQFDPDGRVRGLTVSGTLSQPVNGNPTTGGFTENTVTFPAGRFEAPPVVFAQATNGRVKAVVDQITKDSCRIRSWNFTSGNAVTNDVTWTAIGGSV